MKNLLFILCFSPVVSFVNPSLQGISQAIRTGDASALSQFFDESVEIAILDDEDIYDKAEAKEIVKKFFNSNKPKSFNQVHKGTSKGKDSQYCIGNLVSSNSTYRVYIYMKVEGGKYLIQEMRFDKE